MFCGFFLLKGVNIELERDPIDLRLLILRKLDA